MNANTQKTELSPLLLLKEKYKGRKLFLALQKILNENENRLSVNDIADILITSALSEKQLNKATEKHREEYFLDLRNFRRRIRNHIHDLKNSNLITMSTRKSLCNTGAYYIKKRNGSRTT